MKNKKILIIVFSILVSISFIYWWYIVGFSWIKIIRYVILFYALLYLSYVDMKDKIVPGWILKWMLICRFLILLVEVVFYRDIRIEMTLSAVGGFLMGGFLMFLAYWISHKGMGAGDVKVIAVVGAYTGSSNVYAVIIFSLLLASIYAVVGMAIKKIKLKDEVPFVPFVAGSCLIIMLLGM